MIKYYIEVVSCLADAGIMCIMHYIVATEGEYNEQEKEIKQQTYGATPEYGDDIYVHAAEYAGVCG